MKKAIAALLGGLMLGTLVTACGVGGGGGGQGSSASRWSLLTAIPSAGSIGGTAYVNERIYVFGITGNREVWAYDPATDTWSQKASMPEDRGSFGLAVYGGKVYIVGGSRTGVNGWRTSLPTLFIYDPAADRWSYGAKMPTARSDLGFVELNGLLYAVGGFYGQRTSYLSVVEAYDPARNRWMSKAAMNANRSVPPTAVLDGKIYVLGGICAVGCKTAETYDPVADRWTVVGPYDGTAEAFLSYEGNLYLFTKATVYRVAPATLVGEKMSDLPVQRSYYGVVALDGAFHLIGGRDYTNDISYDRHDLYRP